MNGIEITYYLDMARRRKWWIIIPFLLTFLGGMAYALIAPKVFEAQTLILVQPQKVPEDYVRAIVSTSVEDRLKTITQQVTSRTNLEKIIEEYNLYDEQNLNSNMDLLIAGIRKRISIDVSRGGRRGDEASAFAISFRGRDPNKVMQVTNALASNFIEENLKIRESQAIGTSSFLSDELASVELRLKKKEAELKQYRERYMGGLPEQLQTNLSILERLQNQLEQQTNSLRDAENRKVLVDSQIAEARKGAPVTTVGTGQQGEVRDLPSLKNELASLQAKYTENHPDIVRLKGMIERLEEKQQGEGSSMSPLRVDQILLRQRQDLQVEVAGLKEEVLKTQSQIRWYETKVEDTPKREQELLTQNRDYQNLKDLYDSLLNRKLEAEIAVSLERKQKGEQFRILDPAKIPQVPIKPDLRMIALLTLALGLGIGGGCAFLIETLDTSYKSPEEAEMELNLPVLAIMPFRRTESEIKLRKFKTIMAYSSVTIGFFACALCIFFAAKGIDKTVNFLVQKLYM